MLGVFVGRLEWVLLGIFDGIVVEGFFEGLIDGVLEGFFGVIVDINGLIDGLLLGKWEGCLLGVSRGFSEGL